MKQRTTAIRLATPKDLNLLYPIYDQARRYMVAMGNPSQWGFYYPEPAVTDADVATGHCYVVEDIEDKTILGVFVYFKGDYEPYASISNGQWLNDAPYGVLQRVASAGLGGHFADIVLNWLTAKGEDIRVDTHRDNINMRNALVRHGFRLCGSVTLENGEQRIAFQWRKPSKPKATLSPEEQLEILKAAAELIMHPKPNKPKANKNKTTSTTHSDSKPAIVSNGAQPVCSDTPAPKPMRIARAIRKPKPNS
ncbi:MAG: hypothetical protein Q4A44_02095 [Bacteroidales bacterium]|nr:hypothetical protein [Bacteroidales bacterium]